MRVPYHQLKAEFKRVLLSHKFTESSADECAGIFADNSRDGVHSHGLNRFTEFVDHIKMGLVYPDAEPSMVNAMGALEQWDGNQAPGMLNARKSMARAIELAKQNGIGCIAIKNTNHWMRGGTYGWQAADAGCIVICFTNTIANMPPWGSTQPGIGNNPLVIAVPRKGGHVVLDMAMSQYAIGKLKQHEQNNEPLPQAGGYDKDGNLSTDAAMILESKRLLPAGFWKGSGLAMLLDMLATVLSGGNSTAAITQADKRETKVSQVFICIKADHNNNDSLIEEIISYTKTGATEHGSEILYPGENTLRNRERSLAEGVWVDDEIWKTVLWM
ncbi:3-dehydro-L-gulonate 2-dehydrogenase [Mucilaginibacter segetis]|uniref:3-dehydro-L-gulonate 2-dehydrogenase n=1 Tax=Mucilaginibacter segetis TaxID=2793071 RepID=A0A934UNM5_9SPHI|nr:3-dehydro-L-gulonate 2-dehydrogenase [Mucilaginibacter segetis]MBK0380574.1 3-dehydro-L-gulonate 2-dehydrogenase [Mucilaginibacter segetis]